MAYTLRCLSPRLLKAVALTATLAIGSSVCARQAYTVPSEGCKTISLALIKARQGDTIYLKDGVYIENIYLKEGVTLAAKNVGKARIEGNGQGTVVTMGTNSSLYGIEITDGTIGVFSKNPGVKIKRCTIFNNWMTGIIAVRNLPKIEDNIISFNRSSGIQLWDVRSTNASINHNSIAYNGNHGVAIGGTSTIVLENNIIAFNERYGMKLSKESEKSSIVKNNFFGNGIPLPLKTDNYAFDPAFTNAHGDMNFKPDPKICCAIKASDDDNIGVRFEF